MKTTVMLTAEQRDALVYAIELAKDTEKLVDSDFDVLKHVKRMLTVDVIWTEEN